MTNQPSIIFLCGGYGTRLQTHLSTHPTLHHLQSLPKPLIPLNNTPLLTYWVTQFLSGFKLNLITNSLYYNVLTDWGRDYGVNVTSDGTSRNEDRLGAVKDLWVAVREFGDDDVIVIAGDTLFLKSFNINHFLSLTKQTPVILVTVYTVDEKGTYKSGILELDKSTTISTPTTIAHHVQKFLEKPGPEKTTSRYACPCFYYLPKESLYLLDEFVEMCKGKELKEWDATGTFLSWVINERKWSCFAMEIEGRLDIGALDSYLEADALMRSGKVY